MALITSDERLASTVAEISRSVGLVVDRPNGDPRGLLTMLASAHITLVDDANPDDAQFIAGYASGRGGWVIWLARGSEKTVPAAAGVRFSRRTAGDLEREICSAAFLPSRHWEQP